MFSSNSNLTTSEDWDLSGPNSTTAEDWSLPEEPPKASKPNYELINILLPEIEWHTFKMERYGYVHSEKRYNKKEIENLVNIANEKFYAVLSVLKLKIPNKTPFSSMELKKHTNARFRSLAIVINPNEDPQKYVLRLELDCIRIPELTEEQKKLVRDKVVEVEKSYGMNSSSSEDDSSEDENKNTNSSNQDTMEARASFIKLNYLAVKWEQTIRGEYPSTLFSDLYSQREANHLLIQLRDTSLFCIEESGRCPGKFRILAHLSKLQPTTSNYPYHQLQRLTLIPAPRQQNTRDISVNNNNNNNLSTLR